MWDWALYRLAKSLEEPYPEMPGVDWEQAIFSAHATYEWDANRLVLSLFLVREAEPSKDLCKTLIS